MPEVSIRRICRVLEVPRSAITRIEEPEARTVSRPLDAFLVERIRALIKKHPTYGCRRLWALLRFRDGLLVNRKAAHRILRAKKWFCHERWSTQRPRVQGRVAIASRPNERWATDVTHIHCGSDGRGHPAAIIACHEREIVGCEFSLRGRAKEAEWVMEEACLSRFGTLRPQGQVPVVRSDNGLVFQRRRFRAALRDYRLSKDFITPYTPEHNGMIERFFRSLKEECVWQHNFRSLAEARRAIGRWIEHYNEERPHQSLGYLSLRQYRERQQVQLVA